MKNSKDTLKLAYEQMQEDRATIKESYEKFAAQMSNLQDYAVNGANVNKCLELLTKQTAQLLELAKLQNSMKRGDDDHISTRDADGIYNLINNEVTKLEPRRNGTGSKRP